MNIREKKNQIEKKMNSALQHVRTDFRCMIGEERLDSFMTDPIINTLSLINQTIDFQSKSVDWFLYDKDLRHERVNALLLACIHRDIFLDYDKIIDIYASRYSGVMLLINLLSEN